MKTMLKAQTITRDEISMLLNILKDHHEDSYLHSLRVTAVAMLIAEEISKDEDFLERMFLSSILHDVGKAFVSQEILNGTRRLTEEEFQQIKLHTLYGFEMVRDLDEEIACIVRDHHERYDGKGYWGYTPGLEASIIKVADVYDAMISKRSYKEAISKDEVVNYILKNSGSEFDPQVVAAFKAAINKI